MGHAYSQQQSMSRHYILQYFSFFSVYSNRLKV